MWRRGRELSSLLAALAVAGVVEVRLRTQPLPKVASAVGAPMRTRADSGTEPCLARLGPHGRRQARAVRRVMRHWPFGDTCLRHALVTGHRLRRFAPELVVGVTRTGDAVKAHAWLEFTSGIYDPLGVAQAYLPLSSHVRTRQP